MQRIALAVIPLLMGLSAPAQADIVVVTGVNNQGTEAVTFANQAASATVFGSAGGQTNNFSITGTTLLTSHLLVAIGGHVQGSDSNLAALNLAQTGGTPFTQLVFGLDAVSNGSVLIHVLEGDSNVFDDDFVVNANGDNFFTISAINGQTIQSVTLSAINGASFASLGGVRFGPVAGVPEPATWAMMLLGFAGIGLAMRRRKSWPAPNPPQVT